MNGDSPQSRSEGTSATNLMATLSLAEKNNTELTGDCRSELTTDYIDVRNKFCNEFGELADYEQQDLVETLLKRMNHHQLGNVDSFIKPLLQRDFIVLLPRNVAEVILKHLDAKSLAMTTGVSKAWRNVVCRGMLWRKLIEKQVQDDSLWSGLSRKRGWRKFLFIPTETATTLIYDARNISHTESQNIDSMELQHSFYRELYPAIRKDIRQIEENWKTGKYRLQRINCQSENSKGVYCLQYDDDKIISGLRDNTIKIWNRSNLQCRQILTGHTGSVLCLQYDGKIIASGSSDATVRIWDVETGAQLNTLIHHSEAVLHLRFHNGMLVTCSKDRSIAVWTMQSSHEIDLRRVLVGHRAAVNVVDFDDTYIVSASGDRTIKVWRTDTCEFIRTLGGHRRGIACLQYRDGLIVSGSSDNNIRLWDIECGTCLRVLDGHEELVRCIRFDNRRIVSGAYDGKIKVWDLQMAMDPRSTTAAICINTLVQHTGRVFRLQFDEFQIVSSSHDDTILIWDFLDTDGPTDAIGIPIAGIGGGGVGIGGGGGDAPGGGGGGINNHFGGGAGGQHHLPPAGGAGAGAGAGQMNGNDEDEAQEHDHDDDEDVMVVADDAAMMDAGQHGDGLNLPGPGPAGPGPLPGGNHPPLHHLPFPLHHHPLAAGGGGGGGGGGGVNIEALQAAGPHVRGMMPGGAPPDEQLQLRNMIHQLQQQQQQPNHQMDWDH